MVVALAVLGIAAGVLTSLAGQGGGLFLLIACSMLFGPHRALAMTAPALLLGNLHRAWTYRRSIDRAVATRMTLGALPGALVGGLLAGAMPAPMISVVLVATTALAIAKALGWIRFAVPRRALAPAGFGIGAMTGTAGGAGVLLAPVLLSAGLGGPAFVGTSSVVAVVTHLGRVAAYGTAGFFSEGVRPGCSAPRSRSRSRSSSATCSPRASARASRAERRSVSSTARSWCASRCPSRGSADILRD